MGNLLKINLTKEIITVVSNFNIQNLEKNCVGIDLGEPFIDSDATNYIGYLLDLRSHIIEGSEDSAYGVEYDENTAKKIYEIQEYIVENIVYIEEILHQFCEKGVKPGVYTCKKNERIWKYKENENSSTK